MTIEHYVTVIFILGDSRMRYPFIVKDIISHIYGYYFTYLRNSALTIENIAMDNNRVMNTDTEKTP